MTHIDISQWRNLLYSNQFRFEYVWYMVDSIEQDEVLSEYVAHHNPLLWNILSSPLFIEIRTPTENSSVSNIYASSIRALCLFFCAPVNKDTQAYCSENNILSIPFIKGDIFIYEGVFALRVLNYVLFIKPTNQKEAFLEYPGAIKYSEEDFIYQRTSFSNLQFVNTHHTLTYKNVKHLIKSLDLKGLTLAPVYGI